MPRKAKALASKTNARLNKNKPVAKSINPQIHARTDNYILPEIVDLNNLIQIKNDISECLRDNSKLNIQINKVLRISFSGLQLLAGLVKQCKEKQYQLNIDVKDSEFIAIAKLTGMDEVLLKSKIINSN